MNVSVIIPVYNAGKFVRKAVDSALFHPEVKEVILIEDGSHDNSLEVCNKLANEYDRVFLYQHKDGINKGAGASRNLGMLKSTQDFISFLDADDYYSEIRFEKDKEIFQNNKEADGVYGATGVYYIDQTGARAWEKRGLNEQSLTTVYKQVLPDELFESLIWFNNIDYGYFLLDAFTLKRAKLLNAKILFAESLKLHQDTVFIQQCAYYLKLFTGENKKPIAFRGVHKENRFIFHKKITRSRSKQYKELIKWAKESNLEKKYLDTFKKRYYKNTPRYFGLEEKVKSFKLNLKLITLKFLLSGKFNETGVILISSSPRSGSTMLSNAIKTIPKSYILFEPLNLTYVPEAKLAGFSWKTYLPSDTDWPEGREFFRKVFNGEIINKWTTREMRLRESFNVNQLIIKSVRTNRLLPWICEKLYIRKPILLLRHPCAVISSQLKSPNNWNNPKQPELPKFIEHLPVFKTALMNTSFAEEYLAASWALDQLPALMMNDSANIIIITYEELILDPNKALSKIFNSWNMNIDIENAVSRLKKPSSVVYKSGISGIDGWKKHLSQKQIDSILKTINKFGVDFYDENIEPNYKILYDDNLSSKIKNAGCSN